MNDTTARAEVGVIGGSGFYDLPGLTAVEQLHLHTPYGDPGSSITLGEVSGVRVAFIARHDAGHRLLPSEVPARANIYALKRLGVQRIVAVSAVGSLRETIAPRHAVIPDQLIDRTSGRPASFFGDGVVAHIGFADPFCPALSSTVADAARGAGVTAHAGGALVVINGPAFSTRAESRLYRAWGADIVGMTTLPEAKLAREAEVCYTALCFVTDYDVWHESEDDVSAALVVQTLRANAEQARATVAAAVTTAIEPRACHCRDALADAVITPQEQAPIATRRRLGIIMERYWGEPQVRE